MRGVKKFNTAPGDNPSQVGALIRRWRNLRGRSQLDLSLDSGVSQRHISFIESGRSLPSAQTLLHLAATLGVPLRDRNAMLLAAGYAPAYSAQPWDAAEMGRVTAAVKRMLAHHEPFPAIVLDRTWTVLMANRVAPQVFRSFIDLDARPTPRNLLHLMFDPAGMRPYIVDWELTAATLIHRVYREAAGGVPDGATRALLAELSKYPGVEASWQAAPAQVPTPVVPITFAKEGLRLSYFSLITTVGTPQTVAAQELRIECMFPGDEATEAWHRGLPTPPAQG